MSKIVNTDLDMDSVGMVTNLPAPTNGGDAVNKTYADTKVTANGAITGSTKTKITYDTKGLVTAGADANLDDLGDVVITSPTTNQVLKYNGTNWINDTSSGGASALDDLTDVVITSPLTYEVLRYNGTNWVNDSDLVPKKRAVLYDDFVSGTTNPFPSLGWSTGASGTGAQSTAASHGAENMGVTQLQTGTTTTGWVTYGLGSTIFIFSGSANYAEFYVRIPTLRTAAQEFKAWFGYGDILASNADMQDGAYFTHDSTSANWIMNTSNNNVRTVTATSTAIVANQWYRLAIKVSSGGGSAEFFIDGVSVGTIATNVPTTRATGAIFKMVKSAGTTSRTIDVDYWYSTTDFTTERS